MPISPKEFKKIVYDYYHTHGRHSLPWRRKSTTPYHVMVSEIMLQQTQVDRAIDFYKNFIREFPTVTSLAKSPQSNVLKAWQGLGYNRRALNLKKAAEMIVDKHNRKFPNTYEELIALPGIGDYTAKAILAFAFDRPNVFIETNIRSIYIHHFFHGKENIADTQLLPLIEKTMDRKNPRKWYSALMDYGTFLKSQHPNPSRKSKHHAKQSRFEGSARQARGYILKKLLETPSMTENDILRSSTLDEEKIIKSLRDLEEEGFLKKRGEKFLLR